VYYNYGSDPGNDTQVANLAASSAPTASQTYAAYTYLGDGAIVATTHPAVSGGLTLSYGAAGNYAGWDQFGRVIQQKWTTGSDGSGTLLDGYAYGYDLGSNRLYRENLTNPALSELYQPQGASPATAYDGLGRLQSFARGTLNASKTGLTGASSRSQTWTLDSQGNWVDSTLDGQNQSRTYDDANELTSLGGSSAQVGYDAAGNLTQAPVAGAETSHHLVLTYDAWNRLVQVSDTRSAGRSKNSS
jgi:hypothetical protein